MAQTIFIDTRTLPREAMPDGGEMTEVLNQRLAGAQNVTATLRWLQGGDRFEAAALDRHQLLYVTEGDATLTLLGTAHAIGKGMGVYLEPSESATVTAPAGSAVTLFHLVVRRSGS
jgi:glyoxylate utilization-related uncharacterized protein